MQGLWKDKRSNYLKDKARYVYRNSEKLDDSIYSETFEDNYTVKTTKKVFVKSNVYFVSAYKLVDSKFSFDSCKNCPLSAANGAVSKFTESGIEYSRPCTKYEYQFMPRRLRDVNPICNKTGRNMSYETNNTKFYVYFDYIEKQFRDYFTNELIPKEWHISKKSSHWSDKTRIVEPLGLLLDSFEPIYQTFEETYSNRIYVRGRKNRKIKTDMIYGKPLSSDFFEKYLAHYSGKFYRKYANKTTRARVKNWLKMGLKDNEIFYESFHKSHSLEKSIAWAIS